MSRTRAEVQDGIEFSFNILHGYRLLEKHDPRGDVQKQTRNLSIILSATSFRM